MHDDCRIADLIYKSTRDELSSSEQEELNSWLEASAENRAFFAKELDKERIDESMGVLLRMNEERMQQRMDAIRFGSETAGFPGRVRRMNPWRYLAAAGIAGVLLTGAGLYYKKSGSVSEVNNPIAALKDEAFVPGKNKAILILSDGHHIDLDTAANGRIAIQAGSQIMKTGGQLVYANNGAGIIPVNAVNILSVPRGGQYQLVLPDGTKVWLNSASEISYPVAFTETERRVKIRGEAYFEVAKNAGKPFHVETPQEDIEVLGTSFNVKAYADEVSEQTTLVDGKVKVNTTAHSLLLAPGEQAYQNNHSLTIKHPSLQTITAWRRGFFNFQGSDIQDIMRQLARWYDIDIKYEGTTSQEKYVGLLTKDLSLPEVITALQSLNIKAKIADRTVIVSP